MSFIRFPCLPIGYRDLIIYRDFETQELTYEQWKSVLHLSTLWDFASLRKLALKSIEPPTPHDQLVLARTYSVEEWVLPALTALCSRALPLSLDEARQMDLQDVILVASVREEIRDGALRVDPADIPHCIEAAQAGKLNLLVGDRVKGEAKTKATREDEAKAQAEAEAKKKREADAIAKADVDARAKEEADAMADAEVEAARVEKDNEVRKRAEVEKELREEQIAKQRAAGKAARASLGEGVGKGVGEEVDEGWEREREREEAREREREEAMERRRKMKRERERERERAAASSVPLVSSANPFRH